MTRADMDRIMAEYSRRPATMERLTPEQEQEARRRIDAALRDTEEARRLLRRGAREA